MGTNTLSSQIALEIVFHPGSFFTHMENDKHSAKIYVFYPCFPNKKMMAYIDCTQSQKPIVSSSHIQLVFCLFFFPTSIEQKCLFYLGLHGISTKLCTSFANATLSYRIIRPIISQ